MSLEARLNRLEVLVRQLQGNVGGIRVGFVVLSFSGGQATLAGIEHGLGVVPEVIVATPAALAANAIALGTFAFTDTTFTMAGRSFNAALAGNVTCGWIAVG